MGQRDLKIKSIEGVVLEIRRLRQIGYEQRGQWDLGQIARHLSLSVNSTFDGMKSSVPFYVKIVARLIGKRMIFSRRRMGSGFKAPQEFQPPRGVSEAKEVHELERAYQRLVDHKGSWPEHPFLGKLSRSQWLEFHIIHAQHHLSYLSPR